MWAIIKKALNGMLGSQKLSALDEIQEKISYKEMYIKAFAKYAYIQASLEPPASYPQTLTLVVDTNFEKELVGLTISDENVNTVVVSPMVEVLGENAIIDAVTGTSDFAIFRVRKICLPPSLKELKDNCLPALKYGEITLPRAVEKISNNAFAKLDSYTPVLINNKRGAISGHPWGHPAGDDGIVYLYE